MKINISTHPRTHVFNANHHHFSESKDMGGGQRKKYATIN